MKNTFIFYNILSWLLNINYVCRLLWMWSAFGYVFGQFILSLELYGFAIRDPAACLVADDWYLEIA